MGIRTDGKLYGLPENIIFSMPCLIENGLYKPVTGLDLDDEFSQKMIQATTKELLEERNAISHLLHF